MWPATPRTARSVQGRGSNPAQTGVLNNLERAGESQRGSRRPAAAGDAGPVPAVFQARGPVTADRPPDGDWPVAANCSIQMVRAALREVSDVDLFVDLYLIEVGTDDETLIDTFTLESGARQDAWGVDHKLRTGDRFSIGVRVASTPGAPGVGLTVQAVLSR